MKLKTLLDIATYSPAKIQALAKRWANVIFYVEKWSENDVGPMLK